MSKKLIYLVSFVLLLGLTNMVSAQIADDFDILVSNWRKTDNDLPVDCPRPE